jgi:hypothetical protein
MAEPHENVFRGCKMPQVHPDRRDRTLWPEPLVGVEQVSQNRFEAATFSGHHGRSELIPKFTIAEIRRPPDAFQAGTFRQHAEFGLLQKEPKAASNHAHH